MVSVNGKKLFGTDGIRGVANEWPMTGEVAMAVGRAVASVLRQMPLPSGSSLPVGLKPLDSNRPVRRARIVVGKDTRLSGYMLEQALASVDEGQPRTHALVGGIYGLLLLLEGHRTQGLVFVITY
jgi:phosphomannomutase